MCVCEREKAKYDAFINSTHTGRPEPRVSHYKRSLTGSYPLRKASYRRLHIGSEFGNLLTFFCTFWRFLPNRPHHLPVRVRGVMCLCVRICACVRVSLFLSQSLSLSLSLCVCVCIRALAFMYVCMHACMCVGV